MLRCVVRKLASTIDAFFSWPTLRIVILSVVIFFLLFASKSKQIQTKSAENEKIVFRNTSLYATNEDSKKLASKHKEPIKLKKSPVRRPKFSCMWPKHQSRDVSVMIQPGRVTTVLQSPNICSVINGTSPLVLVMVQSAVASFKARENIRESWALNAEKTNAKIAFLLGQSKKKDDDLGQQLRKEAETFGDIIQEDFVDSWTNLTIKSLMMLKWFDQNCNLDHPSNNIKYLMKVDEDVYVNLPKLTEILMKHSGPNLLMGTLRCDPNPKVGTKYRKMLKTYNPKYHKAPEPDCHICEPGCQFRQPKRPPCLNGPAYVMDTQTAKKLYKASIHAKMLGFEDIFVTGILARRLNIRPMGNYRFRLDIRKGSSRRAIKKNACGVVAAHLENEELKAIHKSVEHQLRRGCDLKKIPKNGVLKCPLKYFKRNGLF